MLIDVDELKEQLHIEHDEQDDLIERQCIRASATLLDYLKKPATQWQTTNGDPDAVPENIKVAVEIMVGALRANPTQKPDGPLMLSDAVMALVHRYRDPAFA